MKKTNWMIKVIFFIYLIAALVAGIFFSVKSVIRDNNKGRKESPLISEYVTCPTEKESESETSSGNYSTDETHKETVVESKPVETVSEQPSTQAPETSTVAPTEPVTEHSSTVAPTEPPTATEPVVTYVPYTFANGKFTDKSKSYTYKVVDADFVKLHTNSDGSGYLTVVPRNATGNVVSVAAFYTQIEYNGYTGYIFNKYIELH
ncbi:MAG: hypothetical protein ACI4E1_01005 [Lachnospira sp.]